MVLLATTVEYNTFKKDTRNNRYGCKLVVYIERSVDPYHIHVRNFRYVHTTRVVNELLMNLPTEEPGPPENSVCI